MSPPPLRIFLDRPIGRSLRPNPSPLLRLRGASTRVGTGVQFTRHLPGQNSRATHFSAPPIGLACRHSAPNLDYQLAGSVLPPASPLAGS